MADAPEVKDVSSTTFGFIIAYLLPGFAGMFAISFFAPPVHQLFLQFIEAESNVGRFLLMILCSLVVGLEVSVVRWIVFEQILCRKYKRDKSIYRHLSTDSKLSAFRAAVDEYYRYHQFWGGMAVVTPFIAWGLVSQTSKAPAHWLAGTFAVLEIINISGGWSAYKNYIDSANKILGVSGHGERLGTEQGRTRNQAPSLSSTPATSSASAPSKASAPPNEAAAAAKTLTDGESCEVTSAEGPI